MTNILILYKFYGTYLAVLVKQTLQEASSPLSVKEIGLILHQYNDKRLQKNFELRIRNALGHLVHEHIVRSEPFKGPHNLYLFKYSIIEHEKEHPGALQNP